MTAVLYNFILKFLSPLRLTGPIFDKELRVSSRRRRIYVLRFAYLALLTVFLALVWIEAMGQSGSAVYRISRMAEAGKFIIVSMVWFQFCVTQFLAVVLLSNSISDEIYHRTLGLLMTTPISSFQIVIGKLFSKLLQLILLMAISLPLLAIIRVMGGVPWNFVISSLCINLTTIIFIGSLSLFYSIFSRRTYVVIILTILTIAFVFALLPLLIVWIWHAMDLKWFVSQKTLETTIFLPNFYYTTFVNSITMLEPRAAAGMPAYLWSLNCGIILVLSTLLLLVSMIVVRKIALRQATGQLGGSVSKRRSRHAAKRDEKNRTIFTGTIRRVVGPPIIWKELKSPIFRHHKIRTGVFVFICLLLLFATYFLCANENALDEEEVHATYAIIFLGIGMLFTIVLPATSITTEIESRSWPVLLATPLDDKDILFGKFIGALRRFLPAWLLLFGHIIAFSVIGFIHPFAIVQTAILVAWVAIFLTGSGLYFSSRFKRTTTAVLLNFALVVTIWAILPLLMAIIASINSPFTRDTDELVKAYIDTNPFVHMGNIIIATAGEEPAKIGRYYWPGQGTLNAVGSTIWMLVCMVGYMLIGFMFAWRAKCQFRRKIF